MPFLASRFSLSPLPFRSDWLGWSVPQDMWGEGCVRVVCQDSRMPRHIESMRDEVERHAKASFFMLHNLAADRCLFLQSFTAALLASSCHPFKLPAQSNLS